MSQLITRNSIFDNFFDDMAPSFLMRPLHGDALPSANQIKIDVNEKDNKFYVNAEIPGVAKEDIDLFNTIFFIFKLSNKTNAPSNQKMTSLQLQQKYKAKIDLQIGANQSPRISQIKEKCLQFIEVG